MSESDWRDQFPTGREQFRYVFLNNLFTDIRFLVGSSSAPVYSHSFVLKVRSPVFERILEKLPSSGPIREIVVPDASTIGFEKFIQFLYTDQLEATANEALEILPLAKKYKVSALSRQCVSLLQGGINEDNAALVFQLAREAKEIELEQQAIQFIANNAAQVFTGANYKNLTIDNLCYLLRKDELDARELILFNALVEWGKEECTRHTLRVTPKHVRMMVKDAIPLIRFPLMSLKELREEVVPHEILNEKEIKDITKYLEANLTDREFVKPTNFSTIKRHVLQEDEFDLDSIDDKMHERLAKLAIMKTNPGEGNTPLVVTSLVLEIEPKDGSMDLDDIKEEIFKIKKFGLFWGLGKIVEGAEGKGKLRLSFAADTRRSYGVGTVVEAVLDVGHVSNAFVYSYKDEIVVRI